MMLLLRLPGGEQGGPGVQRRQQRRRRGRRCCGCCAGRLLLLCCCCCTGALLQQLGVVGPAGGGSSGQEALAIRGALVRCSDPPLGRVREPVTAQAAAAAAAQGLLDSESWSLKAKTHDQIRMDRRNVGRVIGRRSAGASEVLSLLLSAPPHKAPVGSRCRSCAPTLSATMRNAEHAASGAANTRRVLLAAHLEECPGGNNPRLPGRAPRTCNPEARASNAS